MQLLQRKDRRLAALHGLDSFHGSLRSGDGGDGGNASQHGGAANRLLVEQRLLTTRRIDDEMNAIALDQIDDVGPAFLYLKDALDRHPGAFQNVGRTFGRDKPEPKVHVPPSEINRSLLVMVVDAQEDRSAGGQYLS